MEEASIPREPRGSTQGRGRDGMEREGREGAGRGLLRDGRWQLEERTTTDVQRERELPTDVLGRGRTTQPTLESDTTLAVFQNVARLPSALEALPRPGVAQVGLQPRHATGFPSDPLLKSGQVRRQVAQVLLLDRRQIVATVVRTNDVRSVRRWTSLPTQKEALCSSQAGQRHPSFHQAGLQPARVHLVRPLFELGLRRNAHGRSRHALQQLLRRGSIHGCVLRTLAGLVLVPLHARALVFVPVVPLVLPRAVSHALATSAAQMAPLLLASRVRTRQGTARSRHSSQAKRRTARALLASVRNEGEDEEARTPHRTLFHEDLDTNPERSIPPEDAGVERGLRPGRSRVRSGRETEIPGKERERKAKISISLGRM